MKSLKTLYYQIKLQFNLFRFNTVFALHQKATKYKVYKWWSERKYSTVVNICILIAFLVGIFCGFWIGLPRESGAESGQYTWTEHRPTSIFKSGWYSVAVSDDGNKLAAVDSEGSDYHGGYIYTSSDGGANWTEQISSGAHIWNSIATSSNGDKLAAVAVNSYIYTSNDSGATWTEQTAAGSRYWRSIASSSDGNKLVAAENNGYIYTSNDSGATWTEQTAAGSRTWYSVTSSSDGTKLAAVAYNSYIYTSTDGGATWTEQTAAGSRYWQSITSSSDGIKVVAVDNRYIYTSTDGGANWTERTSAGLGDWYAAASSIDGSKLAVVNNDGYIYTSTDGGATWNERTSAGSRYWYSIASSADGNKLLAGVSFSGTIYVSSDNGNTWNEGRPLRSRTRGWFSAASSMDGNKLAAVDAYGPSFGEGSIYTSKDGGKTWTEQIAAGARYWYCIASSSDGNKLVAAVNGGYIYTSTDGGATWAERTSAGSQNWYSVTSSSDGNNLAATDSGGYIYTSTDGGATWSEQTSSGSRSWNSITSSSDGNNLAATDSGGYIYTSTDGGATWTERTSAGSRYWYSVTSSSDGTTLAAIDYYGPDWSGGYIYTSTDGGATWTERNSAGARRWYSIASSIDGSKLAAVVNRGYIYTSNDYGVTWTEQTSVGSKEWYSLASSADGSKLIAGVNQGYLYTGTIDYLFPSISISSFSTNLTSSSSPTVLGTATDNLGTINKVEYQIDSTSGTWSTCSASDGSFDDVTETFACNVSPALSDSSHTIYIRATDSNGNTTLSGSESSYSFTVDTIPPTGNSISVNSASKTTKSNSIALTLASTGASTMMLSTDPNFIGADWQTYATTADFTLPSSIMSPDGNKTIYAKFKDLAGNISDSVSSTFIVDTAPPKISLTPLASNETYSTQPAFIGNLTDTHSNISNLSYWLDNTTNRWNNCSATDGSFNSKEEAFTCAITTNLLLGTHKLVLRAYDSTGNLTPSTSYTIYNFNVIEPPVTVSTTTTNTNNLNQKIVELFKITITDANGKPIVGAVVTIESLNQTVITDANGIATFTNIEKGQHQLIINYNGKTEVRGVYVTGLQNNLEVKTEQLKPIQEANNTTKKQPLILLAVIAGGLTIAVAIRMFQKQKSKKQGRLNTNQLI